MIAVRISYESSEELEAILDILRIHFDIRKIRHSGKGSYKKAYIELKLKESRWSK